MNRISTPPALFQSPAPCAPLGAEPWLELDLGMHAAHAGTAKHAGRDGGRTEKEITREGPG